MLFIPMHYVDLSVASYLSLFAFAGQPVQSVFAGQAVQSVFAGQSVQSVFAGQPVSNGQPVISIVDMNISFVPLKGQCSQKLDFSVFYIQFISTL